MICLYTLVVIGILFYFIPSFHFIVVREKFILFIEKIGPLCHIYNIKQNEKFTCITSYLAFLHDAIV